MIININSNKELKQKVLNWLMPFNTFCFLDNHSYADELGSVECLAAVGVRREIQANAGSALEDLQTFIGDGGNWLFGHLGYDLKNEVEGLSSNLFDGIQFPDLYFFEPEIVVKLSGNQLEIHADDPELVYAAIEKCSAEFPLSQKEKYSLQSRFTKEEYCSQLEKLREHIKRGDCYEINFCQEFFSENTTINPLLVYDDLCKLSPNPFSALYRLENKWLICASPERFLRKNGKEIYSQPIKGTAARNLGDTEADQRNKTSLLTSEKDRSENVMIVDLVRNDLSRICKKGSVIVEELFGVYSFPQVHQLISTIKGVLKEEENFSSIIKAVFPMGSMTGAPKRKVLELTEKYERTKRGIYSGALGYISPEGDFDFNVVIRSIMYNENKKYLSYQVGGGITYASDPNLEWDECLLKANAIKKVLEGN
jgi:para-aminobenzoate synthetase component 1